MSITIAQNIVALKQALPANVILVAVSKTKSNDLILEAYNAGQKVFGENYIQELVKKAEELPKDIQWHFIGHLQSNKVKYIAPFVSYIHSVDSLKLLKEINKYAQKNNRIINCLLQIYIAQEETKFGLSKEECFDLLKDSEFKAFSHIRISGLMGMASNTDDLRQVRKEFKELKTFFDFINVQHLTVEPLTQLSIGMSSDYVIAIEEGSTMIRVGSLIFGNR